MRIFNEGIEVDVDGNPLSNPNLDVELDGPYPCSYMAFPIAKTDGKEDSNLDDDDDENEDDFDYQKKLLKSGRLFSFLNFKPMI
jgi:hypothetical protein